ncbi:hypothetical protein F5Y19DRAFT_10561 [Xylariaceae sp. FL1651]|nr:hypothetical protein F5Y19DRAFT_10561 [Xylariaceae sp. FL1651]
MYFYISTEDKHLLTMSTIYSVPREKRYGKYKKVLYLEPPFDGSVTVKRRVTTIVPPPPPPPPPAPILREPEPTIIEVAPPPPPPPAPVYHPPEPEPEPDSPIDVIAVDVDPSEAGSIKSSKTSKTSRSSKSSRTSRGHSHSREREVYIERERIVPVRVPVPYPVQVEPEYDTYRYVEAPRRYEPRRRSLDQEIVIEDHRRRRYIRD